MRNDCEESTNFEVDNITTLNHCHCHDGGGSHYAQLMLEIALVNQWLKLTELESTGPKYFRSLQSRRKDAVVCSQWRKNEQVIGEKMNR